MKNRLLTLLLIASFGVIAQNDCLFPELTKGTEWTITNYDSKGKFDSSSKNVMKDVTASGNKVAYLVYAKIHDKKDKEVSEAEMNMFCEDGVFTMDMRNAIPAATLEGLQSMDLTISGDNLQYPNVMSAGQDLPNSEINMKAASNGMTIMDMTITVFNRKVEAIETITVPAGEFKCFKISSSTTVRNRIMNVTTSEVQWFAPGIGVIKSQYYDKKGKESGHSELTHYKKG
jgi:hypothetical protein